MSETDFTPSPAAVEAACKSLMPGYPDGLSVMQAMAFAKQVRAALVSARRAEIAPVSNVIELTPRGAA
jgi:hypothetical protein